MFGVGSCEMAGLIILPSGWSALLWNREQVYFYATIGCPASAGFVTGNGVLRATTKGGDAGTADSLEGKIVSNAVGAGLGQWQVDAVAAGAVGVTDNLNQVAVELTENLGDGTEDWVKGAVDIRTAGCKGDVRRHDQLELIPFPVNLYAGVLQLSP